MNSSDRAALALAEGAALGDAEFAVAWDAGWVMILDEAVEYALGDEG